MSSVLTHVMTRHITIKSEDVATIDKLSKYDSYKQGGPMSGVVRVLENLCLVYGPTIHHHRIIHKIRDEQLLSEVLDR